MFDNARTWCLVYSLQDHAADLVLDVLGLVAHRHLGEPGQVHQRQVEDVGRVDLQPDGLAGQTLQSKY